ncbi:MAG: hypothetical protein H0T05_03020 [Acidobacteria bacterium]|nr:hypothetical protein [Acidobacteriota bacterium]
MTDAERRILAGIVQEEAREWAGRVAERLDELEGLLAEGSVLARATDARLGASSPLGLARPTRACGARWSRCSGRPSYARPPGGSR